MDLPDLQGMNETECFEAGRRYERARLGEEKEPSKRFCPSDGRRLLCFDKTYTAYYTDTGQPRRIGHVEWVCPIGGRGEGHGWGLSTWQPTTMYAFDDPKPFERDVFWATLRPIMGIAILILTVIIIMQWAMHPETWPL